LRAALGEEREKEDRLKLIKQTFLDMMDEDLSPFHFFMRVIPIFVLMA
jgi:hypothetical protein